MRDTHSAAARKLIPPCDPATHHHPRQTLGSERSCQSRPGALQRAEDPAGSRSCEVQATKGASMSDERAGTTEEDPLTRAAEAVGTAIGSAAHTVTEAATTATDVAASAVEGAKSAGSAAATAVSGRGGENGRRRARGQEISVERDDASHQDGQSRNAHGREEGQERRQDRLQDRCQGEEGRDPKGQGAQEAGREEVSREEVGKEAAKKQQRSRPGKWQRRLRKPRRARRKARRSPPANAADP